MTSSGFAHLLWQEHPSLGPPPENPDLLSYAGTHLLQNPPRGLQPFLAPDLPESSFPASSPVFLCPILNSSLINKFYNFRPVCNSLPPHTPSAFQFQTALSVSGAVPTALLPPHTFSAVSPHWAPASLPSVSDSSPHLCPTWPPLLASESFYEEAVLLMARLSQVPHQTFSRIPLRPEDQLTCRKDNREGGEVWGQKLDCQGLRTKDKGVYPSPRRQRRTWVEKRKLSLRQH